MFWVQFIAPFFTIVVMAKKEQWLCTDCGEVFGKWSGKCPSCDAWNTIKEFHEAKISSGKTDLSKGKDLSSNLSFKNPGLKQIERISSGIEEVDRVLGGGFFPGTLALFGGSPGVGKSTLALQIFLQISDALYFSGEESVEQVMHRANRLSPDLKQIKEDKIRTLFSIWLEGFKYTYWLKSPAIATFCPSILFVKVFTELSNTC